MVESTASARGGRTRARTALVAALALVSLGGCTPLDDIMASVFGRSMREQSAIQPYQDPRLPAEGTVPFASGNFPAAEAEYGMGQSEGVAVPVPVTPIELLQALGNPDGFPQVTALPNPVPASPASLERGEELYNRACVPCHGAAGGGGGPVTAAGVLSISLLTEQAMGHSDGYLYSIIRVGRGAMPAYGHQISHYDRWHLVNYLRQLQGVAPAEDPGADAGAATSAQGDAPDA
jgi:mono/diheme cytochrome c family protein